jgi:hypothetical protein
MGERFTAVIDQDARQLRLLIPAPSLDKNRIMAARPRWSSSIVQLRPRTAIVSRRRHR